jgi:hypothetical protein
VLDSETPALINTKTLTINYTSDGVVKQKTFPDLVEGVNTLTITENDAAGNQSVKTWDVTVDTVPPVILCNSPATTMDPDYTLAYTVDGVAHSEIRRSLSPWKNELNVSETDAAGNVAQTSYTVNYLPASLPDGTRFIYEDNKLRQEITPDGKTIFYDNKGRVTQFVFTDGRKIVYGADEPHSIFIYGSDQSLIKQIDKTVPSPDETKWIELALQDGIKAYYLNGKLQEIKTATGIRMVDMFFDDGQNIKATTLIYPDGTQEFIWEGSLLRRIGPDGSVLDFLPTEWIAREIVGKVPQYYAFEKLSQTEAAQTKVFTGTAFSVYDEAGILQEVRDGNDGHFIFMRSTETEGFHTQLDRNRSSTPKDKTMVEARYTSEGQLTWLKLQDGTEVFFTDGQISRAVDASGAEIDYSLLQDEGFLEGLKATRSGTQFLYDKNGFLMQIVTEEGTVTRVQEDTNKDGSITDKDVIRLFLDTVSGYKLTDFELDSQGNILKGILETQAGIRQFIENGSVVGFETVDGRVYDYKAGEAELKEWRFQDGKRILYGGGNITEILFADGTRLHTLGFDADHQIQTYTEESSDGTEKLFQDGKLVQTTLADHRVIHYGADGYAEKVVLADGTEQTISYKRDPEGQITGIILEGAKSRREFTSEGELLRLFQNGVSAEVTDGVISKLSTRFGEMQNPQFSAGETPADPSSGGDSDGMLSGTVNLIDGTQLVLENGELKKAVHSDGTQITYQDGRTASVKTDQGTYELSYTQQAAQSGSGDILSDVLVHFEPAQEKTINSVPLTCTIQGEPALAQTGRLGSHAATFDGNGDSLIVNPSEAFDLGTGDFTIEAWLNFSAVNRPYAIASKYVDDGQGWIFYINTAASGQSMALYDSAQHAVLVRNVVFLPNQWYHVAVVRNGNQIKFFKDGVQQGTDQPAAADYNGDAVPLKIGEYSTHRAAFYGSMDEFRISNVARWTASFTPPASEYELDEYTKLLHHFETLGEAKQVSGVTVHPNGDYSLVPFLLEHPDEKFSQALFSRPLYDTLKNSQNLVTELDTSGETSGSPVFFAKLIQDADRDTVYEFSGDYLPEWLNVSLNPADRNYGFISRSVTMGYGGSNDHLPAMTADLIDLTGDGLPDRVFMETGLKADYWWVQVNSGSGFLAPVKWQGVSRSYDPVAWSSAAYNLGSLRFYEGRHPHVLGELIDINGDDRPDRMLVKNDGSNAWYVQLNNGQGFDPVTLWAENVHPVSQWSFQATYALEVRDDASNKTVQELIADLVDMDGDGLLDRVIRPYVEPLDRWFVQKNLGTGFADAVLWEGVDTNFPAPNTKTAASLSWYQNDRGFVRDHADLVDMNGDGRADRVLLKSKDPANPNSAQDWYVQFNNGNGFDPAVLWDADVRRLTGLATDEMGTSLRVFENWNTPRNLLVDLVDVTGDGLPDRVSVVHWGNTTYSSWFVEVNDGATFLPAMEWTGIVGTNAMQTAIGQDNENFRSNPSSGSDGLYGRSPDFVKQVAALKDINGDDIPDRVIYEQTGTRWFVQFGTGSGFLPVQEITLDGLGTTLETSTTSVHSSSYDYLHVSLRSENGVSAQEGSVKVTLGTPEDPEPYQEWIVTDLTTDWQDFYLSLDRTKTDAPEVKIVFVPADPLASGSQPSIYVDNMTFTALRPPAGKDWLDHLLTGEDILADVREASSEDITQYLQAETSDPGTQVDWQALLQAETRIAFDDEGDVREFQTLYGSVSRIESGQITETRLPDGTTVQFSAAGTGSSTTTQQVTDPDGKTQTQTLAYGRVRQVTTPAGQALQYSYEFTADGKEITVVRDPESGVVEKYRDVTVNGRLVTQLISRTQATGVETRFEYDASGNLARSSLWYKGRERESFEHSIAANGNQVITTEDGVREEYDEKGNILRHITPDGYCYTHSFERAKKVVMEMKTITEHFADGTSLNVQVPYLTWAEDPQGKIIHRVTLTGYTDASGNVVEYGADNANSLASVMKNLRLTDGTRMTFDKLEVVEVTDPETGEVKTEVRLLDVTIFHADGTITEFRDGKPYSVTSAAGRVISLVTEKGPNGEEVLIDPDGSAQFHLAQAKKIWETLVLAKWETYKLAGARPVRTEYVSGGDDAGKMVTRQFAEGTIEFYNDAGQVEQVLGPEGERMVLYQYDADGNLVRIQMEGSRRRLESAVLRIKADVAVEREKAMAAIADREQVLNQTIEGEYVVQRDRLLEIRAQIEAQRDKLASIDVQGDEAQGLVADAMKKIQVGLDQVNAALAELAKKRQEALADLSKKVKEAYSDVETKTQDSYKDLDEKSAQIRHSILEQEILPVVFHWYRKILGRDPNRSEYDAVIAKADYAAGTFDLEGLKNNLRNGQEFLNRTAQVNAIKAQVGSELDRYLLLSDAEKAACAARLGIASSELVEITAEDVTAMKAWLAKQPLHFGQSAFIAIEALLKDAGIVISREELAVELILTDILTGTLTSLDQSDLLISFYAMKRLAARHNLELIPMAMTYDVLRAMYVEACGQSPEVCSLRLVARIDGNHFIIITKVTDKEVSYIDPGAGPENALETVTISKEDFLTVWVDPGAGNTGSSNNKFGYVLSPRPPPLIMPSAEVTEDNMLGGGIYGTMVPFRFFGPNDYQILSTQQQMSVRGAFLPFLIFIVAAIIQAIIATVTAIIAAISAIIGGLITGIGSIASGFGAFFTGLFTGNFIAGIQGVLSGIVTGLGQIAGGVFGGIIQLGQGLIGALTGLHTSLVGGISQGLGTGFFSSVFGGAFQSGFLAGFVNVSLIGLELQGIMTLMDAIGIAPVLQGSFMNGLNTAMGIGLLATGNPLGIGFAVGGATGFLGQFTDLSPELIGIIGIGATALGAFASGVIAPGISGLQALQSALPYLSADLASAGVSAVGNLVGLDPRLTGLLSIPVSAAVGGMVGGYLDPNSGGGAGKDIVAGYRDDGTPISVTGPKGLMDYVSESVFSPTSMNGIISVGASLGLDAIGAPVVLQNFLPGLLGQIAVSSGLGSDIESTGQGIFSKIWDNIEKFGSGLVSAGASLVSFGTKVVEGVGSLTKAGFAKAVDFFSGMFDRQTQETLVQAGNGSIENYIETNAVLNGETASVIFGDAEIVWNQSADSLKVIDATGTKTYSDISMNDAGRFLGNITIAEQTGNDVVLKQNYTNGRLDRIDGVSLTDDPLFSISGPVGAGISLTSTGMLSSGIFQNFNEGVAYAFEGGSLSSLSVLRNGLTGAVDNINENEKFMFQVVADPLTQQAKIVYDIGQNVLDSFINAGELPPFSQWGADTGERLGNYLMGFDFRTSEEITQDRALKMEAANAIAQGGDLIFGNGDTLVDYGVKAGDRSFGLGENRGFGTFVNHVGIIETDSATNEKYVIETNPGGFRRTKLEDFIDRYRDFEINRPKPELEANLAASYLMKYINPATNLAMDGAPAYDYLGLLGLGFNSGQATSSNPTALYCSSAVYNAFANTLNRRQISGLPVLPGVTADLRISPQDIWQERDEWDESLVEIYQNGEEQGG